MNGKVFLNWLRAGLSIQQICEISGCERKAEYCISRFRGRTIMVCSNHLENVEILKEVLK